MPSRARLINGQHCQPLHLRRTISDRIVAGPVFTASKRKKREDHFQKRNRAILTRFRVRRLHAFTWQRRGWSLRLMRSRFAVRSHISRQQTPRSEDTDPQGRAVSRPLEDHKENIDGWELIYCKDDTYNRRDAPDLALARGTVFDSVQILAHSGLNSSRRAN